MSAHTAAGDPYASLDDLFGNGATDTTDVELPGGRLVCVRGLTRMELLLNARDTNGDAALIERRNLVTCMVAPTLTETAAQRWQESAAAGDLVDVVTAIRRLSGLESGAPKSDVAADGDDGA